MQLSSSKIIHTYFIIYPFVFFTTNILNHLNELSFVIFLFSVIIFCYFSIYNFHYNLFTHTLYQLLTTFYIYIYIFVFNIYTYFTHVGVIYTQDLFILLTLLSWWQLQTIYLYIFLFVPCLLTLRASPNLHQPIRKNVDYVQQKIYAIWRWQPDQHEDVCDLLFRANNGHHCHSADSRILSFH